MMAAIMDNESLSVEIKLNGSGWICVTGRRAFGRLAARLGGQKAIARNHLPLLRAIRRRRPRKGWI